MKMKKRKIEMNKLGQISEGIVMIYRLLIITVIAFVIFGVGAVFYDYEIDVRDAEAVLLGRGVVDCLAPEGVLNLDEISEDDYFRIVSYCGMRMQDRFYVGVEVLNLDEKSVANFYEGDSGALWIRDLYGLAVTTGNAIVNIERIGRYEPGYFEREYFVFVSKDNIKREGKIKLEILVNYDE